MKGVFEKKTLKIIAKKTTSFQPYAPMFHAHGELVYVLSGKIVLAIDGKRKTLEKGQMSVAFPYVIHSYEKCGDAEVLFVLFSPECTGEFENRILSVKPENPYIENGDRLLPVLERICEYSQMTGADAQRCAKAYLGAVIGEILLKSPLADIKGTDMDTTRRILVYCSQHYKENIDIKTVSESVFVSERYITRVFSEKIGYPFRKYINMLRIVEAKSLIENMDMKIIDIMYESGFENQSSFNRIFYDETGMTPREYRKLHK